MLKSRHLIASMFVSGKDENADRLAPVKFEDAAWRKQTQLCLVSFRYYGAHGLSHALCIGCYVFVLSDLERAVLSAHQHHVAECRFIKLRKIRASLKFIGVVFIDPFQLVPELKQYIDLMLAHSRAVTVAGELADFAVLVEELDCMMTPPLHDRFACTVIKAEIQHAKVIVDILILARVDVSLPRFGLIEKDRAFVLLLYNDGPFLLGLFAASEFLGSLSFNAALTDVRLKALSYSCRTCVKNKSTRPGCVVASVKV